MSSDNQWPELAKAAQTGDKRAYSQLLKEIYPFIRGVLIPKLSNPEWADDIAQEVLISVHKSLHTYSPERAFKPWLNAIVHYRKADYLRKHYANRANVSVPVEEQINLSDNVTSPEDFSEYRNIERELDKLPKKQQEVFRLVKIEGYSTQEVAEKTGMSESAVKVSAHRTLEKLKQNLNEDYVKSG